MGASDATSGQEAAMMKFSHDHYLAREGELTAGENNYALVRLQLIEFVSFVVV